MQTWTAMQIPTSKLQKRQIIQQIRTRNIHILRELPQTDVVIESKLDSSDNLWDLGHHGQNCYPNEILEEPNTNVGVFPGNNKLKAICPCSESCADLWDFRLVKNRLNVLCDQISTSRGEHRGHNQDEQGPPPWPVDHCSMVPCDCTKSNALNN